LEGSLIEDYLDSFNLSSELQQKAKRSKGHPSKKAAKKSEIKVFKNSKVFVGGRLMTDKF